MRECRRNGCPEPTTDAYCSARCQLLERETSAHRAQANRQRIIDNRSGQL